MQQAAVSSQMSLRDWAMLLLLSLLWGGSFLFVGMAVKALPPFTIVAIRVTLAALVLNLVLKVLGQKLPLSRPAVIAFGAMGLLNNAIPFSLIAWGQTHIAGGVASILNATTPLFTVLVMHVYSHDEKLTTGKIAGVALGFAGVVAMVGSSALEGLGSYFLGELAVLGAAVTYGFSGIFGRRFKTLGIAPVVTATGMVTASSLVMLPLALIVDQPWKLSMPGAEVWIALVSLAVFSTAFAYLLFFRILASAGMTNTVLVTFLVPIFAISMGIWRLGESLQPKHFLGMALIGCGLAVMDGRLFRLMARRTKPGF